MKLAKLEALNSVLDTERPLDIAVRAALNIMFYSLAQTGELTVPLQTAFEPAHHAKLADIRDDKDRNGLPIKVIHLPVTKSSLSGEDIFFAAQTGP